MTEDPECASFRASLGIPDTAASCQRVWSTATRSKVTSPQKRSNGCSPIVLTQPGWRCRECRATRPEWAATSKHDGTSRCVSSNRTAGNRSSSTVCQVSYAAPTGRSLVQPARRGSVEASPIGVIAVGFEGGARNRSLCGSGSIFLVHLTRPLVSGAGGMGSRPHRSWVPARNENRCQHPGGRWSGRCTVECDATGFELRSVCGHRVGRSRDS